ncbi:MAG: hypothetical protein QXT06_06025 [Candidatus Bathyarchaeia archaeon]
MAYTPGLKILRSTVIYKERTLPVPGRVLVKENDRVSAETIVAETEIQSGVEMIPLAYHLGIEPEDIYRVLLKKVGETVKEGELIALSTKFFGLIKSKYYSPVSGTLEYVSDFSGVIGIRKPPTIVRKIAYVPGEVVKVIGNIGVVIRTRGAFVQGILGVSGERIGELKTVGKPNEVLSSHNVDESCAGKILVGGALATLDFLKKAADVGAKGVVVGGINAKDLVSFLGYVIGVAITGSEDLPLTLIITEGFGKMNMAPHTFDILSSLEGKTASINGATQIRAGVIRPEVIVPEEEQKITEEEEFEKDLTMNIGTMVRIIRAPYFGQIGKVVRLPVELQKIETESFVRVVEIELSDGRRVIVPRANVEIIEV